MITYQNDYEHLKKHDEDFKDFLKFRDSLILSITEISKVKFPEETQKQKHSDLVDFVTNALAREETSFVLNRKQYHIGKKKEETGEEHVFSSITGEDIKSMVIEHR